ncbi:MAG TPA: slipin family protein [Euryarchaeota archaeon]|nr:modulator of FtsH protease HflK [archaeon BMS3Bbin15]HDL15420.1 slipin family protein [Euryarchaeota archaeon]
MALLDGISIIIPVVLIVIAIVVSGVKVVSEYERGVIYRMGRYVGVKGPGMFYIIPMVDRMFKLDLRTITMDVPSQDVITRDNVPVRVNAVIYFRTIDPGKAINEVENYLAATSMIAQTTLRSVVGEAELDELLSEREKLNERLQKIIDTQTDPWGIKVTAVEIKDVEIPQDMQRAMAAQAEAERERRAKIISAQGEYQAAEKLSQAAEIMSEHPASLQLRFLQTVTEAASEKSSIFVLPIPIDIIQGFMNMNQKKKE